MFVTSIILCPKTNNLIAWIHKLSRSAITSLKILLFLSNQIVLAIVWPTLPLQPWLGWKVESLPSMNKILKSSRQKPMITQWLVLSLFHIADAIDREGEDDQPTWNHLQHRRRTLDHHVQYKSVFWIICNTNTPPFRFQIKAFILEGLRNSTWERG